MRKKIRKILSAVTGIVGGLALAFAMAAPAGAATARAQTIYPQGDEYALCSYANSNYNMTWNSQPVMISGYTGGGNGPGGCANFVPVGFEYVYGAGVTPCNSADYCEMVEVSFNGVTGLWTSTGRCAGWNQTLFRLQPQTCDVNKTGQLFGFASYGPGTGIGYNYYYLQHFPNICIDSWRSVLTADPGGEVYMSCPQGAGGHSYISKQMWYGVQLVSP